MPFFIYPFRRFPVCCPVTYQCGDFEGDGTIWNVSLTGWRVSGNLPLRIGEVCPPHGELADSGDSVRGRGRRSMGVGRGVWHRNTRGGS
jgi:hypothetical protein